MRPRPPVPAGTLALQATASDPALSAWVSANAGSGKTHVLAQRVIRLLLAGCDPSRILCLTYTRAAAANMSNRVFRDLAAWAMLDDDALAARIAAVEGRRPETRALARARRLFARALETPGGLKIQTIHAFCESVLHQFPLEANIAAHFQLLDPLMEAALVASARRDMITGAGAGENPGLAEAFATVLQRGGERGLDLLLNDIVRRRDGLRAFIDAARPGDRPFAPLYAAFGLAEDETAASAAAAAWPLPGFAEVDIGALRAAAEAVDARTVLNGMLPPLEAALMAGNPETRLGLLVEGLLTGKGEPYKASAFKKDLVARLPDLPGRYLAAADRLIGLSDRLALLRLVQGTVAVLTIADWMIARYERLKASRGFLDFNDLITRTVNLLARQDAGAWVQYKLDKGIDHILIDEAQDTSPDQWNVVRRLAEEFFAGEGAREGMTRTVFAVGDEKQSIYSFQGAAPDSFARSGHAFRSRVQGAGGTFERVRLHLSFRSTPDVLAAVDRVFSDPAVAAGVTLEPDPIEHSAIRDSHPGYVELWPSLGRDAVAEPDDWRLPVNHVSAPAVRLAEQIATTVAEWLRGGEMLEGQGRRLRAGDVLVLVRKRDRFVHALSRSLKNRDIPVAGADRLALAGHIAVRDLMALGRHLLQPHDDLSLAAVLKSPIFGLTEDELYALAAGRGHLPLAATLRAAGGRPSEIAAQLDRWADEAAFRPVFEFYAGVLGRDGVRRLMVGRLGNEAGAILDEFLNFCLAQEQTGLPGLEAFLSTLETAGPEIKREMDQGRDEVRIMTVHAAKGLEAPVVFLVDSGSAPMHGSHLPTLMPFRPPGDLAHVTGYLWRSGKAVANASLKREEDEAKRRGEEEYRRLLYVGMTRAEDRLVVCGYHGRNALPDAWHALVARALAGAAETTEIAHPAAPGETVLRFRVTPLDGVGPAQDTAAAAAPLQPLPAHFGRPLAEEEDLPRPLSPSGAIALIEAVAEPVRRAGSPVLGPAEEPSAAIRRGLVVHTLLQRLPDLDPDSRAAAAERYLEAAAADLPAAERQVLLDAMVGLLQSPDFAPLFGPGSRAEVAVTGQLAIRGRSRVVSGQIDRLAVTAERVTILDYKTNRPAPVSLADVPPAYVLQLALYRALVAPLYPGRCVDAALLFTDAPRLIPVPAPALDAALARLTEA